MDLFGVPHVKVFDFSDGRYLLSERLDHFVSYTDFAWRIESYPNRDELFKKLKDFAIETSFFEKIGDLRADNLVYSFDQERWLLLDWTDEHRLWNYRNPDAYTIGSYFFDHFLLAEHKGSQRQCSLEAGKYRKSVLSSIESDPSHPLRVELDHFCARLLSTP